MSQAAVMQSRIEIPAQAPFAFCLRHEIRVPRGPHSRRDGKVGDTLAIVKNSHPPESAMRLEDQQIIIETSSSLAKDSNALEPHTPTQASGCSCRLTHTRWSLRLHLDINYCGPGVFFHITHICNVIPVALTVPSSTDEK